MRYDISLKIDYHYDRASDHARNLLHLLPLTIPGRQEVMASLLDVEPSPQERRDAVDFFGNRATWVSFHHPVDRLSLTLKAKVNRPKTSPAMDLSPGLAQAGPELSGWQDVTGASPHHFIGPSPRVEGSPDMTDFARACLKPGMSMYQAVMAVGKALHTEMTFDAEATDVETAPSDAFAGRHGVCQDFSHIMIACLRAIGIPAGYVSGFLRTIPPPGQERLEGSDAMHAWVRAWCGAKMGWLEYDPTNDLIVDDEHVVVGYGRDYADVSPIRGSIRSSAGQRSTYRVDVVPLVKTA